MARRSLLGALVAALAVVSPVCAQAATAPAAAPVLATAPYVSPALLQWTPGVDPLNVSQTVMREPGTCAAPTAAATVVRVYADNTTTQHYAQPGDGTWCFFIRATDSAAATADSAGLTVRIDTTPPTATVAISHVPAGGTVSGTVRITGSATDAGSGVAGRVFRVGAPGACATAPVVAASWDTTAVPNGTYDVCTVATDVAGNVGVAHVAVTVANPLPAVPVATPVITTPPVVTAPVAAPVQAPVSKSAPKAPTKVVLILPRQRAAFPTLRWTNPKDASLDRVVVVLNRARAPRSPSDGKIIYRGLSTAVSLALRIGQTANVALYAYDRAGEVSAPARRVVSLAALIPLRPVSGSVVAASPTLTWKARPGVAYYNVQIFRNGKRIQVGWPRRASYRPHRLKPGTYVWFVWPAVPDRTKGARFGTLIGRATFTYGS